MTTISVLEAIAGDIFNRYRDCPYSLVEIQHRGHKILFNLGGEQTILISLTARGVVSHFSYPPTIIPFHLPDFMAILDEHVLEIVSDFLPDDDVEPWWDQL